MICLASLSEKEFQFFIIWVTMTYTIFYRRNIFHYLKLSQRGRKSALQKQRWMLHLKVWREESGSAKTRFEVLVEVFFKTFLPLPCSVWSSQVGLKLVPIPVCLLFFSLTYLQVNLKIKGIQFFLWRGSAMEQGSHLIWGTGKNL